MKMKILTSIVFVATLALAQGGMGPGPGVKTYSGAGGPAFVNGGGDYSGGGSLTTGWSPTNGNTLIVWTVANDTTTTHTCSDGEGTGNTYTPDGAIASGLDPIVGRIFHASNISGSGTYTITCTGTTPFVAVIEISGNRSLATTSVGTNPSLLTGNSTVLTPSAFTPTAASTIQIDGYGSIAGGTLTISQVDSSFTTNSSCNTGASCFIGLMGYRAVSVSASYSNGINTTDTGHGVVVHAAYQ